LIGVIYLLKGIIWDGRKNMNPNQNNLRQNEGGEENITTETKKELIKTE
jgi:hypothetical protein